MKRKTFFFFLHSVRQFFLLYFVFASTFSFTFCGKCVLKGTHRAPYVRRASARVYFYIIIIFFIRFFSLALLLLLLLFRRCERARIVHRASSQYNIHVYQFRSTRARSSLSHSDFAASSISFSRARARARRLSPFVRSFPFSICTSLSRPRENAVRVIRQTHHREKRQR